MKSIVSYVGAVSNESSEIFIPEEDRIAVFDFDGTLFGELFLVFGNSSGDLAMAQYAVQNGGRGYMLLCDDTERDYGDPETAEEFAKDCEKIGLETVSMKNDFTTIYKEGANKVVPKSWGESASNESTVSEEMPATGESTVSEEMSAADESAVSEEMPAA